MTDSELLAKLVEAGCCVGTDGGGTRTVAFAGLDNERCWWAEMFPEDQHHTHSIAYQRTQQFHDRDLAFFDENAVMVLYFAPYDEWPEIDIDRYLDTRSRWLSELQSPESRQRLTTFVCQEFGLNIELESMSLH